MGRHTCFFIGHRDAPESIYPELICEVERHIAEFHVQEFVIGNRGNFDSMAARAVCCAKLAHPDIKLILLLAYHPAECSGSIPRYFDDTLYPLGMESVPRRLGILKANQYMINHADHLIAYAWQTASNASNLVEYAKKRRITVTMLGHKSNSS